MKPSQINSGSRRGSAVIEWAIASLVFVPLLLGTVQSGYKYFVYDLLSGEVRDAARYTSRRTFRCADAASIAKYKTAVSNMARYGNPQGTGELLEPGLSADQIKVEIKDRNGVDAGPSNAPAYVVVSTAGFAIDALHKKIVFEGKPILQFPYLGHYAPASSEP
jgi:hypothetical protein